MDDKLQRRNFTLIRFWILLPKQKQKIGLVVSTWNFSPILCTKMPALSFKLKWVSSLLLWSEFWIKRFWWQSERKRLPNHEIFAPMTKASSLAIFFRSSKLFVFGPLNEYSSMFMQLQGSLLNSERQLNILSWLGRRRVTHTQAKHDRNFDPPVDWLTRLSIIFWNPLTN